LQTILVEKKYTDLKSIVGTGFNVFIDDIDSTQEIYMQAKQGFLTKCSIKSLSDKQQKLQVERVDVFNTIVLIPVLVSTLISSGSNREYSQPSLNTHLPQNSSQSEEVSIFD